MLCYANLFIRLDNLYAVILDMATKTLIRNNNETLVYQTVEGRSDEEKPGVVFLGGSQSNMNASKATAVSLFCQQDGRACTRFDYYGHGKSSGRYEEGTIGHWLDDTLAIIDKVTTGPLILVGSSLGGWLMMLAALHRPERIVRLVGISAAPDFTEELMWNELSAQQKQQLEADGVLYLPNPYCDNTPYIIAQKLIEEAREHLLLQNPIDIHCPVHLLQGMQDNEVPTNYPIRIANLLASENVTITTVKNAGHSFSQPEQLDLIMKAIAQD